MPHIFTTTPGTAAVLVAGNTLPTFIALPGFGTGAQMKAVLTGLNLVGDDGHQVSHSLRTFVWIYSFGPRVKELVLQGVYFAGVCGGDGSSGLERVLQYFENNRLSATGQSIQVTLGAYTALAGFLVSVQLGQQDAETGLGQFALRLRCPPIPKFNLPALPNN